MKQVHRRVVWLGILLLVVAALTALTALPGTTKATTFARDSHHRTPTPTPTTPTPTPTIPPLVIDTTRSYATSLITNVIYYKIEHFSLFEDQKTPDDHFSRLSSC
jgi:hypothetical protein